MIAMILYLALMAHMGDQFPASGEANGIITGATVAEFDPLPTEVPKESFPSGARAGDVIVTSVGPRIYNGVDWVPIPDVNHTPMDVPAIEANDDLNSASCLSIFDEKSHKFKCSTRWTCADKSRVLMTAEDGTRHCIKF